MSGVGEVTVGADDATVARWMSPGGEQAVEHDSVERACG